MRLQRFSALRKSATGLSTAVDTERYVAARAGLLHERLQFVAACAARGELDGVEYDPARSVRPHTPHVAGPPNPGIQIHRLHPLRLPSALPMKGYAALQFCADTARLPSRFREGFSRRHSHR